MHLTASGTRIFESASCLTGWGFERIHDKLGVARRATPNRGDRMFEGSRRAGSGSSAAGDRPSPELRPSTLRYPWGR